MKRLAIIPARSGSKGLHDKNIKNISGKPLLAYTIEAAMLSNCFDEIMVSTDSEKYAEIAVKWGASVPFLRSLNMAGDKASSWDTVLEVLEMYRTKNQYFDTITLLQPTSPLRNSKDIIGAFIEYNRKKAKAMVSVCEMEHSPLWSNVLPDNHSMVSFLNKEAKVPRQSIQTYYRINGAIYIIDVPFLMENQDIYREGCYAYIMERENSIDIDNQYDFTLAECLINKEKINMD